MIGKVYQLNESLHCSVEILDAVLAEPYIPSNTKTGEQLVLKVKNLSINESSYYTLPYSDRYFRKKKSPSVVEKQKT